MDKIEIAAYKREDFSKKKLKQMRTEAYVPGVMYGQGREATALFVHASFIQEIIYLTEPKLIELNIQGVKNDCIIKQVQTHPVNGMLLHVDFYNVDKNKDIVMNIQIELIGTAIGVKQGGLLIQKMKTLPIKSRIDNMPSKISIDISNIEAGKTFRIQDVPKDPSYTFIHDSRTPLFTIKPAKAKV